MGFGEIKTSLKYFINFFLQVIYPTFQNITSKRYSKKKLQINTAPTITKSCQYSLSARLKANEKKKMKIMVNVIFQYYCKLWQTNGRKGYERYSLSLFESRIYLIEFSRVF